MSSSLASSSASLFPRRQSFSTSIHSSSPRNFIFIPLSHLNQLSLKLADSRNPHGNSSSSSKNRTWVKPNSPRVKLLRKKPSDHNNSFFLKLAESLDSCDPTEQQVSTILKGLGDNNVSEGDAVFILDNMTNPRTAHIVLRYLRDKVQHARGNGVVLYNVTLKVFRKFGDFLGAQKVFDEMLQRGVKPDSFTFMTMINCATMSAFPVKAVEWFQKMPGFGCEPNAITCSAMVCAYARTNHVDMAIELYDRAKTENWPLDAVTFAALIKMYGMLGNSDGCLSVYNDMKVLGTKPNMVMYNALLYSMGRAKRAREAKVIYKEMRKNGFSPNWSTYDALLEAFSRARFSKDALSVYKTMKEKGMVVNKFHYSMLLDMCADIGYPDEAVQIFEDMKRCETCQPDIYIYSSLINMYSCSGKISEAEAMLNEMIGSGIEPNVFVLTMFVHCYGKAKQTDDVVKIFNQFWDLGITPDYRLCDCLLYVLTQIPKQDHGKITDCIEKANPKLGCVVRYLLEEKEGNGDFRKEALELFNSVDDDVKKSLCNSLIDVCEVRCLCYGKAKRTDDVVKVFNQLSDLGITPDDRFCCCLLNVMTQIPKEELGKIIDCIEKANTKLGSVVRFLVEGRKGDGDFRKEVSELFNSIESEAERLLCNCLIDLCINLNVPDIAHDLFDIALELEIYKDIQSKSQTEWSLYLKCLSLGAAITALHFWINDLYKALELGEELPPLLRINTGRGKLKYSSKSLASVVESHLQELNAPFHEAPNKAGWFLITKDAAESWLESMASTKSTVLDSLVLGSPTMVLPC